MRSRIVISVAEDYFAAARADVLAAFDGAEVERLGPDAGSLAVEGIGIAEVAEACRRRPIVFVRHLMREVERIPLNGAAAIDRVRDAALAIAREADAGRDLALQVWTSGPSPIPHRSDEVWRQLADGLNAAGVTVARAGRDRVLSVYLAPTAAVVGCNRRGVALVDWPGGRVRLARDADQISRSEFKLEELLKVFDLQLPIGGLAVDLGASPGGWSRILRRGGLTVWAVDPADLDPRVAADPGVRHLRMTAGRFLREVGRRQTFDVLVNDMRMVADLSCRLTIEAANRLKPGALAVVTLKLAPRDALPTVERSLGALSRAYEIVHARQLYHNRHEVTVVARRR